MKKALVVLRAVASVLVILVALVFTVLEATLLITADFMLYENATVAFLQLCLRFVIPAAALVLGVVTLIGKNPRPVLTSLCLTASCAAMAPFISNGFGLYILLVALLFTASCLLLEYSRSKQ